MEDRFWEVERICSNEKGNNRMGCRSKAWGKDFKKDNGNAKIDTKLL